ncbi:N-acetyl-gamma-glutamyl-phosphate reductase [Alkalicoccus urumqiensis]|uniref:N-acetyl-gamma-glutamyl-phosphate reductase n=1 Tax=Alkalicoccus urumqiensis TaxID=1548213 RepID=A0A2P6MKW9_ALKUR|nr:N-acetyl-gamma-glutamyl-phosphate reductase [Alkalicoccus urumqiensis]PRO66921.1 N-acetyl-gamma-glutamyl-phosphate reductase [Alkalicoccus urumqiensis]
MKQAAIIGGTGYGALELIRLLQNHPYVNVTKLISRSEEGVEVQDRYPHIRAVFKETFSGLSKEELTDIDIVFIAAPAGVANSLLPQLDDGTKQFIDLSGDLRIDEPGVYEKWYGLDAPQETIQKEAVYGLTEWKKDSVRSGRIISNPGCFATAALLGLLPLLPDYAEENGIIIDGKTGVSGAGRKQSLMTHFSETNENVTAYKTGAHQHTPEIEQYLTEAGNNPVTTMFQTHLIPMTRGIMNTMYVNVKKKTDFQALYETYYADSSFVRIQPAGVMPVTKQVLGSNFCDIGLSFDERTGRLLIVSVIDNLGKGASGQAVQNMNVMNGWEETEALWSVPQYP